MSQIAVRNPRTGEIDYHFTPDNEESVADTCAQVRTHQKAWLGLGLEGRASVLRDFAANIATYRDEIIAALSADTGRRAISAVEVDGIAPNIEKWLGIAAATEIDEGRSKIMPHIRYRVERRPYPLVGIISPWNFPLTLSLIDAMPALTAGAAVVIKPSEVTPRFIEPLRKAIEATDLLRDIFKLVSGAGDVGAALGDNVDAICFTGSVATGMKVGEQAARNFIPSFLELGGKDPAIVLGTADIDRATTALLRGSILNAGQACQSIERIYVARPVFDLFLEQIIDKEQEVTLSAENDKEGILGPIIFENQAKIIEGQIEDAKAKGATIHSGGEIIKNGGSWVRPTIITGLTDDMTIMTEETFGPLLPIIPFDTVEEAIALANDSDYGLSASVFAGSVEEAITVGAQIEAGGISINDAALTALMNEAEKDSFKKSGLGSPRMGTSGYTRFFRKQSFMINEGDVAPIQVFDEANG